MTTNTDPVSVSDDGRGRVTLTIDRPEQRNAFDENAISWLTQEVVMAARRDDVRVIVITGAGDMFSAGTDVAWMEHLARTKPGDDARRFANLLSQIRACSKPVIARVNGPAIGAAAGLVATCDISVAAEETYFAFSAVRLGTIAAAMSPFVAEAIGVHQARRLFLTGETFDAMEARRLGIVHAVCLGSQLDDTIDQFVDNLRLGSPQSLRESKALLNSFGNAPPTPALLNAAAKVSERVAKSDEAREGLAAFIEKRNPTWLDR